jgi:hypothetical protein
VYSVYSVYRCIAYSVYSVIRCIVLVLCMYLPLHTVVGGRLSYLPVERLDQLGVQREVVLVALAGALDHL